MQQSFSGGASQPSRAFSAKQKHKKAEREIGSIFAAGSDIGGHTTAVCECIDISTGHLLL